MKTLITLILGLAATQAMAQTIVDYVPGGTATSLLDQVITNTNTTATNTADIKKTLDDLLTNAKSQLSNLDKQLERMGDYKAANAASITDAKTALDYSATDKFKGTISTAAAAANGSVTAKFTDQLVTDRATASGTDVFSDSPSGMITGIGTTYTYKVKVDDKDADGKVTGAHWEDKTESRDPTKYTQEAKRAYDINSFYTTYDEAIARQKKLEEARLKAFEDLLKTQDNVETQRLTALIASIDTELLACRQDVQNKSNEIAMHEKALSVQAALDAKSKSERPGKATTLDQMQQIIDNAKANRVTPKASQERFPFGKRFNKDAEGTPSP